MLSLGFPSMIEMQRSAILNIMVEKWIRQVGTSVYEGLENLQPEDKCLKIMLTKFLVISEGNHQI